MTIRVATLVIILGLAVVAIVAPLALGTTIALPPLRDDGWGIAWSSLAQGPGVARARALAGLAGLMTAGAVAVAVVAGLAILALSVARAARQRREIAIRRAAGASRRVLARAALVQGSVIVAGGLAAGGVAVLLLDPQVFRAAAMPGSAVALLALLAGCVALGGLLPLVFARHRMPGADARPANVPLAVPAVQLGLGLLALIAGAQVVQRAPSIAATPAPSGEGIILEVAGERAAPVLDALRHDAAVSLLSLSSSGTLLGMGTQDMITTECGRCSQGMIATPWRVVYATNHLASADTFRAIGLRVLEGRALRDTDRRGSAPVAVISRNLAQAHFEGGRALGRQVRVGAPDRWYRVVGIVDDGRFDGIGADAQARYHVYLAALQHEPRVLDLLVRPRTARAPLPAMLEGLGTPVLESRARAAERDAAHRFAGFLRRQGGLGIAIAVVGLATVMWLWVRSVMPEIALRRAVGARRRDELGRVARRGALVAAGGAAMAWWLAPLASEILERAVPGVPTGGLGLVPGPLAFIIAAGLLAALGPAWWAMRSAPAAHPGLSDF